LFETCLFNKGRAGQLSRGPNQIARSGPSAPFVHHLHERTHRNEYSCLVHIKKVAIAVTSSSKSPTLSWHPATFLTEFVFNQRRQVLTGVAVAYADRGVVLNPGRLPSVSPTSKRPRGLDEVLSPLWSSGFSQSAPDIGVGHF